MEKPIEPNKEDCCNSGCNPCIFDVYEKQVKLYNEYLVNGEYVSQENGITQMEYTSFVVVKKKIICNCHALIKFKKAISDYRRVYWKPGDHFLFKYTIYGTVCTRAYTPFTIKNEPKDDYDFAIIVKKYDYGMVSSYLYNINNGCSTIWRGPYGNYDIERNKFDKIIMIAQGTCIVAFIDIIDRILNNEDDFTKLILLYCCKSIDTILFRAELYDYKSYWNFKYEIYTSFNERNTKLKYQADRKSVV